MFEAVGFKLFNLVGVESPHTHWIQLRIIDDATEANPKNQYDGDFWGLYLVIEEESGRFLDEHGLPSGNLYKMEGGTGELGRHKADLDPGKTELNRFLAAYHDRSLSEPWWRTNLDLPRYYSYRSIIECIHHYDVADGKNYDYYHNSVTGRWSVHPWDIDLTWADNMYGGGSEPFAFRVLTRPTFKLEYQNRLREIRDLLFNRDQAYKLIDEYAAIISDPNGGSSFVDADRALWDFHPALSRSEKGLRRIDVDRWRIGRGALVSHENALEFGCSCLLETQNKIPIEFAGLQHLSNLNVFGRSVRLVDAAGAKDNARDSAT